MRVCIMCSKEHEGKYGSPLCDICSGVAIEASFEDKGIIISQDGNHKVLPIDKIVDKF